MKKIIRLIVLLLVLALAISFLGSLGNFGGALFGDSSHKHNSGGGSVTPPVADPEDPDVPGKPDDPVEFTVTLSPQGIATANTVDAMWFLFDTNQTLLATYKKGSPVDFSQYMTVGESYSVKVSQPKELGYTGEYWSDWVIYTGAIEDPFDLIVTLRPDGIALADTAEASWFLHDASTHKSVARIPTASFSYDFSSFMTLGNRYYVKLWFVIESPDQNASFTSNTVVYTGKVDENFMQCPYCNEYYDAGLYAECPNPDCPSNVTIPEPDPMTVCPECNKEYNTQTYSACPNPDCPLNQSTEIKCTVCGIGYLSEANGICSNSDCPTNNPITVEKCSFCGTELEPDGSCPNADCPLKQEQRRCTVCNNGYLSEAHDTCSNPDCPTNNPITIEKCSSCGTELVDGECPNEDCPSKYDPTIPCTVCNNGSLSEANGICSNPDCPTNNPTTVEKCPSCDTELVDGECPNDDCPSKYDPTIPCTVCGIGSLSEANGICSNSDCPTNNPTTVEKCPFCDTELVDGECPNDDCPSKYDPTIPCTVCNNGSLSEANGVCSNPDCPTNNPTAIVKCPSCDTELVDGECPNDDCPSKYDPTIPCTVCNNGSLSEANGICSNPDCPTNNPTTVEKCPSCDTELVDGECLNDDCPSKYDPTIPCTVCNNGSLSEANGVCNNPDCPTNNPITTQKCPSCGTELVDGECPNDDCPLKYDPTTPCTVCNNGYYTEGSVYCSNPDCPTNSQAPAGNWLFWNEFLTTDGNMDLPAPVPGVSYTCFVDGVELETCTAYGDGDISFGDSGTVAFVIYYTDVGWHFHPIDSNTGSGYVSIRVNGDGVGGVDFPICTECGNGYTEAGADCNNPDCPSNREDTMVDCPDCGNYYDSDVYDSCPNPDCFSNENSIPCDVCGTGYLSEGNGICNNLDCPSRMEQKYTVTLSADGYATVTPNDYFYEAEYTLYLYYVFDGTSKEVSFRSAEGFTCDFSNEIRNAGNGQYYVVCDVLGYDSGDEVIVVATCTSNIITVGGSDSTSLPCPDCDDGYLSEANGICNNPDCPSNQ